MRLKTRLIKSATTIVGAVFLASSLSSCAYLRQPRSWGACAIVGAALGAGAGAASGIVIADNVRGHGDTSSDAKTFAGIGGAAAGALIGGLAGHYICDPIIPPPPPPPA